MLIEGPTRYTQADKSYVKETAAWDLSLCLLKKKILLCFYIGLTFASFSVEGEHAEMFY